MDDHLKDAAAAAWKEVLAHPRANLKNYLESQGVVFTGGVKPAAHVCPFCKAKKKFALSPGQNGNWNFKCWVASCTANEGGGVEKYIQLEQSCDWKQARRFLHNLTGIPGFDEMLEEKKKERRTEDGDRRSEEDAGERSGGEEEIGYESMAASSGLTVIRIPAKGLTVYESAWNRMKLLPKHRSELKPKRGMTDEWIDSFGLKSTSPENRELLAPILDEFPPNELLRSGLVERDPRNQSLKIADIICGRERNEETGLWETVERVIIPYVDGDGRIVLLRPHKKSLSNSRWREREVVSAEYEKLYHNLRIPYGEVFLTNRDPQWAKTAVILEGEHKAMALRMCGIPALGFQGIHYFLQNKESKEAVEKVATILRKHGIMEVIVVFDQEDKSHKDFKDRFEAEIFARFTAEELENKGFRAYWGTLPEDWMENKKADWDSRLAWHVRQAKDPAKGIARAKAEFHALLTNRSAKSKTRRIFETSYQVDFLNPKEDVINQALYRLRYEPKIFVGGKWELNTASEIQNFCIEKHAHALNTRALCQALRDTMGGYYKVKAPSDKQSEKAQEILEEIREEIEELEADFSRDDQDEDRLRRLRATRTACFTILYRYPKPFTDFSAESRYKVLVYEPDGSPRHDRLIVFRDQNGVKSRAFQLSPKLMGSSQELRKFFLSMGHYHWNGGQEECDLWTKDLDLKNYQQTIEEIDTYGWNDEHKFYLLGDCAVVNGKDDEPSRFIFPDRSGIIWINGIGYKNSETMSNFMTQPPVLFPGADKAREAYEAINWDHEQEEVSAIWESCVRDFAESFGGYAGYAFVSAFPMYLAHGEIRSYIGGKPSLWVQGEKGSGKTKSVEYAMRMIGYPLNFGYITLGGTKIGLERTLSQYHNLPLLVDEWRYENVDAKIEELIRSCFNEISTAKGTPNGNKGIRKSTPLTMPIICGENATNDAALRSRYLKIIASPTHGSSITGDESEEERKCKALEDDQRRDERFYRIMDRSEQYYRIGRFLFHHRARFAKIVVQHAKEFAAHQSVMEKIRDSRARQVFGCFFGSFHAAQQVILGKQKADSLREVNAGVLRWFIQHGSESAQETDQEVFRTQFFRECVTMINREVHGMDKLIRVRPGYINENGQVKLYSAINEPNARLFVLVAGSELHQAHTIEKRRGGENPSITRLNIMSELRQQIYWVPAPKPPAARQHRFAIPNEPKSSKEWWVLDFKKLDPEMKNIFQTIYERELEAVDIKPEDMAQQGLLEERCPF